MGNKFRDAFDTIKANEALKDSTIEFLQSRRQKATVYKIRPAVCKIITAACVTLILTIITGVYFYIQTPVSFVSIDVNPSVELTLNRLDRVRTATAFNGDGEAVLEGISVKGKPYTEAINLIMENADRKEYLTDDAELVFTVAAGNRAKESELRTGIENCHGCKAHGGHSTGTEMEIVSEAHDQGVSIGKYSAYLQLAKYDESMTVEDCHDMTMSEIHRLISEHKQGRHDKSVKKQSDCPDNAEQAHRSGHNNRDHE
ncbi:hypothetical protein MCG98_11950 [Ruminococcus sp. OA3]|uniref:anti-sigma-I factor RsgI family protein n=1 Tax=Ruminococcus sp. OA3 TaxID=2914164 RepID=UPI001F06C76F|nr:hypothetical protein [Ruminococcus sp. OA3]MCH1983275.1 hypothetical protein [Ruminococcus sp. OA3]